MNRNKLFLFVPWQKIKPYNGSRMKIIKRFIYLLYYLRGSENKKQKDFLRYSSDLSGKSRIKIMLDAVRSVFRYNISVIDYFYFRFFLLSREERLKWAGTGYMYEYQLKANPKDSRKVLEDKISFLQRYATFIERKYWTLEEIKKNEGLVGQILSATSGRLILKDAHGQVGAQVEVISVDRFTPQSLIKHMARQKYDLIEEYVIQHHTLMDLSPSGLNTVRIFTQLHQGKVDLLGARLRISVNSPVDNMGAGNLAAPVDEATGIVIGPAVYSDIRSEEREVHPITGVKIVGFAVPYWDRVLDLVKEAALHIPENKSIGWDIAITETGPELIEGNHNWCKLLWQLPVKKGLKHLLEAYDY